MCPAGRLGARGSGPARGVSAAASLVRAAACGAGAGVIELIVKTIPVFFGAPPSLIPTIGASGAIFGILMANAVLFPDRRIWLIHRPVTIPMRRFVAGDPQDGWHYEVPLANHKGAQLIADHYERPCVENNGPFGQVVGSAK